MVGVRYGYTWDNEGRMTQIAYPGGGPVYQMTFDAMGRLGGLNEVTTIGNFAVAGLSYGVCVRYSGMAHFATLIWPTPGC